MSLKIMAAGLGAAGALLVASGCKKEPAGDASTASQPAVQVQNAAQIHWLGMDRVAAETNASRFTAIWREPESRKLLSQTLDKLAAWMFSPQTPAATNPAASQNAVNSPLRPLLDDLVQAESYLEVRQVTSRPGDLLLAIRLPPQRAALWETNLAAALETLTGTRPSTSSGTFGWQTELRQANLGAQGAAAPVRTLSLSRSGEWTVLGLTQDSKPAPLPPGFPPPPSATNYWVTAELDLGRVSQALALGWQLPANTPSFSFNAIGDGENVISRGELKFAQSPGLRLDPWEMPTNLISGNLISLTAMRGLAPWLSKLTLFSNLPPANLPDQLFIWGRNGAPFQTFFAFSVNDATNALNALAGPITNLANPRMLPNNGTITLDPVKETLSWPGLRQAQAFLKAVTNSHPQYLFGGFAPELPKPIPMPPQLRDHILEGTNLVYFSWEIAGQMLPYWRYLDDVYRLVFDNQGPRLTGTTSLQWAATNLTSLSHTVTELRLEAPDRLSFIRKSTVGFNSLELDALANWLELPQFPRGLGHLMDTNPTPSFASRIRQKQHKRPQPQGTAPH